MKKASVLESLGFRKGWIYETIISTYSGKEAHSAPMGVSTPDNSALCVDVYKTSETCSNIISRKAFSVNLSSDLSLFYDSVYKKEAIVYGRADKIDAPIIARAEASLGVCVQSEEDLGDKVRFTGKILGHPSIKQPASIKLINRGETLALEALIAATKIPYASAEEKDILSKEIRRICRVVSRVSPGSNAERLVYEVSFRL